MVCYHLWIIFYSFKSASYPELFNLRICHFKLLTGTSSQIPVISCLVSRNADQACACCLSTRTPEGVKNLRRNTSAILRVHPARSTNTAPHMGFVEDPEESSRTILIDVGKSFCEAARQHFPANGLSTIDAVLLTHPQLSFLSLSTFSSSFQPHSQAGSVYLRELEQSSHSWCSRFFFVFVCETSADAIVSLVTSILPTPPTHYMTLTTASFTQLRMV